MVEKLKTVNIKGKEYVEVNERVKFFRKEYEGWRIVTELISNENSVCVFKASIKNANDEVISTGYAYEKEDASYINKTSYIENCETSAVGRALGFLGIGIDTSIASSDEVTNAMKSQETKKVDFKQVREKLGTIQTVDELTKYWNALHLSEKQAAIVKSDFTARRVELTMKEGTNGVE